MARHDKTSIAIFLCHVILPEHSSAVQVTFQPRRSMPIRSLSKRSRTDQVPRTRAGCEIALRRSSVRSRSAPPIVSRRRISLVAAARLSSALVTLEASCSRSLRTRLRGHRSALSPQNHKRSKPDPNAKPDVAPAHDRESALAHRDGGRTAVTRRSCRPEGLVTAVRKVTVR